MVYFYTYLTDLGKEKGNYEGLRPSDHKLFIIAKTEVGRMLSGKFF